MKHFILLLVLFVAVCVVWKKYPQVREYVYAVSKEYGVIIGGFVFGLLAALIGSFFSTAIHLL